VRRHEQATRHGAPDGCHARSGGDGAPRAGANRAGAIGAGAWDGLEELRGGLRALLARCCRDENEIDDVVQETLLRAARYRAGPIERDQLRSWAWRIARNVLADSRRRAGRITYAAPGARVWEYLEAPDPAAEPGEEPSFRLGPWVLEKELALARLGGALDELRDEDRRLLRSFYAVGTSRGTSAACGVPEHLVKVRLFRARRRLVRSLRRRLALLQAQRAGVGGAA